MTQLPSVAKQLDCGGPCGWRQLKSETSWRMSWPLFWSCCWPQDGEQLGHRCRTKGFFEEFFILHLVGTGQIEKKSKLQIWFLPLKVSHSAEFLCTSQGSLQWREAQDWLPLPLAPTDFSLQHWRNHFPPRSSQQPVIQIKFYETFVNCKLSTIWDLLSPFPPMEWRLKHHLRQIPGWAAMVGHTDEAAVLRDQPEELEEPRQS